MRTVSIVFVRIRNESRRNRSPSAAERHPARCQAPQSKDERQEQTVY